MMRLLLVLLCFLATACTTMAPADSKLAMIEAQSGGRLGVALRDETGKLLLSHRGDERFAMCSTFKFLLAAMVIDGADGGRWSLDDPMPLSASDLVTHSPETERHVAAGYLGIGAAAEAAVVLSDNAAANLLLERIGGPDALTAYLRKQGDSVTRLDRMEPGLNENVPGDPRDSTSPNAISQTALGLLENSQRRQLRDWMIASPTGRTRIRAGLPDGWIAGDKTGTCGTAFNDVAVFWNEQGGMYSLAAYLDRPTVGADAANRIIADVAQLAVHQINGKD